MAGGPRAGANHLSVIIDDEGGWVRAFCRELNVVGAGGCRDIALNNLAEAVRLTARHICSLNGYAPNVDKEYAALVVEHWDNVRDILREVSA